MPTGVYDRASKAINRTHKPCPKCGKTKSIDEFCRCEARSDGRQSHCKSCMMIMRRTTQRGSDLKRRFGITVDQFDAICRAQDFKCAICLASMPDDGTRFHVDHDHKSSVVRGVLCGRCNKGLGHFKDKAELIQRAAEYLRRQK